MTTQEIESGIERLGKGFMVPEIWEDTMLTVETNVGTETIPDEFGNPADHWNDIEERYTREFEAQIVEYCEGNEVYSVERVSGFFARLSAPGYMDCTDTAGPFESKELAAANLVEMYDDDIPDDEDEQPEFTVVEYSSFYAVRDNATGKEHPMGDGVDVLSDEDGRSIMCGTEEFRKLWEDSLNSSAGETREAYFPEDE